MKNKRIIRAYDSINPTNSEKERMMKNILAQADLEEDTGMQSRRVRPDVRPTRKTKSFRAGRLLPFAACFAALLLGGFLLSRLGASQENPVVMAPTSENAVHGMTTMDHYAPVLEKYRRAIEEGWTKEQCEIEGISPNMQYVTSTTGYTLLDLDGDRREELIIAQESGPDYDTVWDLYTTLEDGTPIQLWSDEQEFVHCCIYKDNIIGIDRSRDQPGEHEYYILEAGQLVLQDGIEYEDDGIIRRDTNGNTQPISSQEAMEIVFGYKHQKLDLIWLQDDLTDLQDTDSVDPYAPVLEKYKTALTENWSREQCDQNGISRQIMSDTTNRNDLGWCILDMDQNGIDELVISDGSSLFDLYTLQNGLPVQILSGHPDSYTLCADGTIQMHTLFSKGCSWSFYVLSDRGLMLNNILIYRNEYEGTKATERYYFGSDGDNVQPISKDEAGNLIVSNPMKLELTPFMEKYTFDPASDYQTVLERYQLALKEKWDPGKCVEHDISLMVASFTETPDRLCAFYLDLDRDSVQELMITDGMMVFDLYTMKNGQPVHLLTGWERNSYRYCADNVIFNHASNSAYNTCYNYYCVVDGELMLVDSIVFDASKDPDNPWFLSADGETPGEAITEQKAREIMDQYVDMTILGIPILQLP